MIRKVSAFVLLLLFIGLLYVGSALREANVTGLPVLSQENLKSAVSLFLVGVAFVVGGLLIPWERLEGSDKDKSSEDPKGDS
jgi:hypothetical protein